MTSPYLTFAEAAAYARIDHLKRWDEVIYRAVRRGKLKPAARVGRQLTFTREAVEAWLRSTLKGRA